MGMVACSNSRGKDYISIGNSRTHEIEALLAERTHDTLFKNGPDACTLLQTGRSTAKSHDILDALGGLVRRVNQAIDKVPREGYDIVQGHELECGREGKDVAAASSVQEVQGRGGRHEWSYSSELRLEKRVYRRHPVISNV